MDPLPSTNVVLLMVTQDEKQRELTSLPHSEKPIACAVQAGSKNYKKEKPTCAHCGMLDHLKEKCLKIHGYPPGYRKTAQGSKPLQQSNNVHDQNISSNAVGSDITPMYLQNFQQFIGYLQAQMSKSGFSEPNSSVNSVICMSFITML